MAEQGDRLSVQPSRRLPFHGYAGIAIIIAAEILLFGGNQVIGRWFTAIVWTGYILFVDSMVYRLKGSSLVASGRVELVIIAVISIACWWLFEFYNSPRFWQSGPDIWWHYHDLEPNPYVRRAGYDWAFATIFPALFETAELIDAVLFKSRRPGRAITLSRPVLWLLIGAGTVSALVPLLVVSAYLVPLVWLAYILLLDPVNYLRGWPSITGDLAKGNFRRLASLLLAGLICGVLWEFWNYWAISKWTYTVPYLGSVKLFEMPVLGFLGFPPFAIECWAMYIFCRSLLGSRSGSSDRVALEDDAFETFWIATEAPSRSVAHTSAVVPSAVAASAVVASVEAGASPGALE
jgi:hypothetical protein